MAVGVSDYAGVSESWRESWVTAKMQTKSKKGSILVTDTRWAVPRRRFQVLARFTPISFSSTLVPSS